VVPYILFIMRATVLILLVLLLCGCLSQGKEENVQPPRIVSSVPELQVCNSKGSADERETCYMEVAMSRSNVNLCEEISAPNIYNLCVSNLAKMEGDPALCVRIKKDDWRYTDCIASTSK